MAARLAVCSPAGETDLVHRCLQGKTTEAQADLARLSLIKAQREEAAKKRAEEKAAVDAKKAAPGAVKK